MNSLRRQRGVTTLGWLIIFVLVSFFALLLVRLAPAYMEYFSVAATLDAMREEPFITKKTPAEVRKMISRRFGVNDVKTIRAKDIKIEGKPQGLRLLARYEVRTPFIANVDLVTRFEKQVEISAR